jgi:ribulose-phosphate 3-epimerase
MTIEIAPSILSANFAELGKEVEKISKCKNVNYLHLDVMDGNFVPNITIGPDIIKSIRPYSNLIFDTHLMINDPQNHIASFANAGSDLITIHYESTIHIDLVLSQIKSLGKKSGISIIPSTNENVLDYILDKIDLILVMSVNPGFGGQKFLDSQIQKIKNIRKKIDQSGKDILLQIDGGIDNKTAKIAIESGADILVSGSYIFGGNDYQARINDLIYDK